MKEYDDIEFLTDSAEEIAEKERIEEIRRITREEVRRVRSGAADEIMEEEARQEEEATATAEEEKANTNGVLRTLRLFITGEILIKEEVAKFYNYVFYVALIFFFSILTLFGELSVDTHCRNLASEVDLLHERSIRLKEQRFRQCSHSAIVKELERRGIELYDPLTPSNVIN